jgi:3-hydroxy acid dehydrogenase/malonic semialdehyde reductase
MSDGSGTGAKVALVTGASAGLGAAITRRLAGGGWRVVAVARRMERLRALADELGEAVLPLALDLEQGAAVTAALGELPAGHRDVDLLVNNAGLAIGMEPVQEGRPDEWDRVVDVNCRALIRCTRALLPGMVARRRGHVINLGSVAATYPYAGGAVYGASKAFVRQFSLDLRSDLHGTGVRVTCIEPGMVGGTEFSDVRFRGDAERAAGVYAGMQALTPDDIAETVWWTASLPAHVNVNVLELMPADQSFAGFQVHRAAVNAPPES